MVLTEGFTAEELKMRLVDKLENGGIRDKLKAQLRSKLYAELALQTKIIEPENSTSLLLVRVVDSLLVEYLRERELEFTLSVFLPESGLGSAKKQTRYHTRLAFKLSEIGKIGLMLTINPTQSLLRYLFENVTKYLDVLKCDQQVQTNIDVDDLLHMKIRDIDNSVRHRQVEHDARQIQALEERLHSCQRELEDQSKLQVQQQVESFKKFELAKLKVEAKREYQSQIEALQAEFKEKILYLENQSINNLETERKRMIDRERDLERNNVYIRQQLLEENNKLLLQEKNLRNEIELVEKQTAMERDMLKVQLENAKNQMNSLQEFKEKYTQKMEESMAQYKIELNKEHYAMLSAVELEKMKLKGDREVLNQKALAVEKMLSKVSEVETEAARYKLEVHDLNHKLEEITKARDSAQVQVKELELSLLTQKSSSSLEFEISSLKKQLLEQEKAAQNRQSEHEKLIKNLMEPKNNGKQDLQTALLNEAKWKQQCQDLVEKLDAEFAHSEEMTKLYQKERLRAKELERELADLRVLLHQTQNGNARTKVALSLRQESKPLIASRPTYGENEYLLESNRLHERYNLLKSVTEKKKVVPHPSAFEESLDQITPPKSFVSPKRVPSWKDDLLTPADRQHLMNPKGKVTDVLAKYESDFPAIPSLRSLSPFRSYLILEEKASDLDLSALKSSASDLKNEPNALRQAEFDKTRAQTSPPSQIESALHKEQPMEKAKAGEDEYLRKQELERLEKELETQKAEQERLEEQSRMQKEELERFQKLEAEKARVERENEERLQREKAEKERQELEEQKRIEREKAEQERLKREEQERVEQEKKKDKLLQLENDPLLQKYMAIVKEKRQTSIPVPTTEKNKTSESSDGAFGAGNTEDELSAPENQDSSSGPSW